MTKMDGESGVFFELFVPYASLHNAWHVLELLYLDDQSGIWTELHASDDKGAYGSRWLFSPPAASSLSDDFVTATLQLARNRSDCTIAKLPAPLLPKNEKPVHDAFEVIESLLDYHYSQGGWESVKWASEGFFWLCRQVQKNHCHVLGQRAVAGLALRVRQLDVKYRPLHFGSSELACSLPGQYFDLPAYPLGVVGDCFRLIGRRARHGKLVTLLGEAVQETPPAIVLWPFTHFTNNQDVFKGKTDRFLGLRVENLLHDLSKLIVNFDPHAQGPGAHAALSDQTWAEAHNAAEKRLIRLRSLTIEGPGPLNEITAFGQRIRHLHFSLRKILRPQAGGDLEWVDLPGLEVTRANLQLVFWIAALGRATAHGWYSTDEYINVLGQVFSGTPDNIRPIRQGLSLCIGIAPEWFALAMLLWDLILSDTQKAGSPGNPK